MEIIDEPIFQQLKSDVKYAGFWQRFGALIVDGLVLGPLTFGVSYYNIISWKSPLILVVVTLVGLAYKPFMEFKYGATLGKMALSIKVTNLAFGKPELSEILLRNIFHLGSGLLSLFFTLSIYNSPGFEAVTGFMEYSQYSTQSPLLQYTSWASSVITIVDAIVLLADKQNRSLHDRIGGTVVIEKG
jgi:uncharacterized RDD family membrane protein YckC